MSLFLAAKLHDVLKLSGDSKIHFCPEWCADLSSLNPTIRKALKHHCIGWYWTKAHKEGCNPFPIDKEMLCIHLADIKAATISRSLRTSKYFSYKTFKVWKDTQKSRETINGDKEQIKRNPDELIKKIATLPNLEELYNTYQSDFLTRAEDAARCPFASLHTHNELTALWYTFFLENHKYLDIPDTVNSRKEYNRVLYAFAKKKISLVRIKLNTQGKLSRLRDTKVIQDIPEILAEAGIKLNGITIYSLPEELLLVTLPDESNAMKAEVKELLGTKTNYYFETTVVETVLSNKQFLHNYKKLFGQYREALYPKLNCEIHPIEDNEASHRAIICDMCQMAPAIKVYPQEIYPDFSTAELVEEFLCEGCLKLRAEADRAKKLATWEDEEDVRVAFFKISLDMKELVDLLRYMFKVEFALERIQEEDLGFSVIKEFLQDYEKFLDTYKNIVFAYEEYGNEENHESILKNLFCIKIKNSSEVKPLVTEYIELFGNKEFFPKLAKIKGNNKYSSPIKLSVTISNVKHPFMDHWSFLNNPQDAINIFIPPKTRLQIDIERYSYLKDIALEDKRISSALHNLAEVEERTKNQFLVTTAMLDMKNDLKKLAEYLITTQKLSVQEALAYYKIMRD